MRTLPSGHAKRALAGQLLLALRAFSSIAQAFSLAWAFVESNFFTFAVPNTVFGLLGALAGPRLLEGPSPLPLDILWRAPVVLFFNFYSVLIFDLANQYPSQSVAEDRANKPWRPLPAGRLTSDQARRLTLLAASAGLVFNYGLGLWSEGLLVQVLSYYYNELEGSGGLLRDAIIAVSYGLANRASLKLAAGPENRVSPAGHAWTAVVSGVVLTTMHVQDIKDQRGDRMRGRKTLPLLLGDGRCRVALAVLVPSWSLVNVGFWRLGLVASASYCLLAAWIAQRVLTKREAQEDARTWRIWCFWLASLYAFPLFGAP
ncbi:UbiA prenyltransferase [Apiospora saccharicola]